MVRISKYIKLFANNEVIHNSSNKLASQRFLHISCLLYFSLKINEKLTFLHFYMYRVDTKTLTLSQIRHKLNIKHLQVC
jgi:hypothetical protein